VGSIPLGRRIKPYFDSKERLCCAFMYISLTFASLYFCCQVSRLEYGHSKCTNLWIWTSADFHMQLMTWLLWTYHSTIHFFTTVWYNVMAMKHTRRTAPRHNCYLLLILCRLLLQSWCYHPFCPIFQVQTFFTYLYITFHFI